MNTQKITFVSFLLWTVCLMANAQHSIMVGNLEFLIHDTYAEVMNSGKLEGAIVIPETVDDKGTKYTVKRIARDSFYECMIESVEIPNTVERIGSRAFCGCANLKEVTFPSSLKEIGVSAFARTGLTRIDVPNNVTTIEESAFMNCQSLTEAKINCKTIGEAAFKDDNALRTIMIGENASSILYRAFYKCASLESVSIADSLKVIGGEAFYECGELKNVEIKSKVVRYGANPFKGCNKLNSVKAPSEIKPAALFAGSAYTKKLLSGTWIIAGKSHGRAPANVKITITLNSDGNYIAKVHHTNSYKIRFNNGSVGTARESATGEYSGTWDSVAGGSIKFNGGRKKLLSSSYTENGKVVRSHRPELMFDNLGDMVLKKTWEYVDNNTMKFDYWVMKKSVTKK